MKQIILNVLDGMTGNQTNLDSDAAREVIADSITGALESNGVYKQHTEIELEKQEAKKEWICQTCGKSTFETDYDYLVHPKLHLGCALEEELKGKTIHEQYHEASSKAHEDDVAKALGHMDDDGNYITKDIPEEKEELKGKDIKEQYHEASSKLFKVGKRESVKYSSKGPEYDYRENPQLKSILNNRIESVEEPEGSPYTPEEIEAWNRSVEDCGTQQPYDKYKKK